MQAIDAHDDLADPGLAVLGRGLPPEAEALIARAGLIRNRVAEAQALLDEAHALAPSHPATLIALYRFHFYGNRLRAARDVGERAIACAAAALGLPADWRRVEADARFRALEPMPRFWLFSLKGYAYLSASGRTRRRSRRAGQAGGDGSGGQGRSPGDRRRACAHGTRRPRLRGLPGHRDSA